ncbi:MAG: TlpA disulfide reductase family protein [Bacteroidales bacterium]
MKISLILCIAIIALCSCNNHPEETLHSNFVPNGKGIIRFHGINSKDTNHYSFWYNTQMPISQYKRQFSVYSDTMIEYKIEAAFPVVVNFDDYSTGIRFMVLPNDTLNVYLEPKKDKPLADWVTYKGKTGLVSTYLSKKKVFLYDVVPLQSETPSDFNKRLDSLKIKALDSLNQFTLKTKLPDWFLKYEKANIVFTCEYLKYYQYNQRYWKYNQFIEKELKIDKEMADLLIHNEWMSDELFSYLSSLRENKFDTILRPQHVTKEIYDEYTQDNINHVKGKLSPRMLSYFVAAKISVYLWRDELAKLSAKEFSADSIRVEKLFNANKTLITDTATLRFITDYKTKRLTRANYIKQLKTGEQAPGFHLEGFQKNKVSLDDFKGKLVCLNFWATWCGPCIQSIPKKNELVNNYGDKNFVLLNICLDNNSKAWKEIIKTKNFKGIHLSCPGNWSDLVSQKYGISSIPHYTLIDKSGNVIMNDISRDSLEYYVKANM